MRGDAQPNALLQKPRHRASATRPLSAGRNVSGRRRRGKMGRQGEAVRDGRGAPYSAAPLRWLSTQRGRGERLSQSQSLPRHADATWGWGGRALHVRDGSAAAAAAIGAEAFDSPHPPSPYRPADPPSAAHDCRSPSAAVEWTEEQLPLVLVVPLHPPPPSLALSDFHVVVALAGGASFESGAGTATARQTTLSLTAEPVTAVGPSPVPPLSAAPPPCAALLPPSPAPRHPGSRKALEADA